MILDFQGQQVAGQTIQNYSLTDVKGFLEGFSIFPTAAIQLGIGTVYGTSVAVRWFPKVNIKDLGDFTYWGLVECIILQSGSITTSDRYCFWRILSGYETWN